MFNFFSFIMYRLRFILVIFLILSLEIIPEKSFAMISKSKSKIEEDSPNVKREKIFSKYINIEYWKISSRSIYINGNTLMLKEFFTDQLQTKDINLNKIIMYTAMKCECADSITSVIKTIYKLSEMDNNIPTQYFQNLNEILKPTISILMEFGDVVSGLQLNEPYFLKTLLILHFYINNLTYNKNKNKVNKIKQNSMNLNLDTDDQFIVDSISEVNQAKRVSLQIINLIERFNITYCYPVKKKEITNKIPIEADELKNEFTQYLNDLSTFINSFEKYSDAYDMNNVLLENCVHDNSYAIINLLKNNVFRKFCKNSLQGTLVKQDTKVNTISIRDLFETVKNTHDIEDIYKYYKSIYEVILNIVYKATELFISQKNVNINILKHFLSKLQSMNCPIELVNNCKLLINLLECTNMNNDTIDKKTILIINNNAFKNRFYFSKSVQLVDDGLNVSLIDVMESITDDRFNTFWWIFNLLRNDSETTSDYQYSVSLVLNPKLFEVNENFKCNELTKIYSNFIHYESLINKCFSNKDTNTHNVRECFSVIIELRLKFSYNLLQILGRWSTDDYLSSDGDLLKIIVAIIIYLEDKHNTDIINLNDGNKLEEFVKVKSRIKEELKRIGDIVMNLLDNYQIRHCTVIKNRFVIFEEISKVTQDDDSYIEQIHFSSNGDLKSFTRDENSTSNNESDSDDDFVSDNHTDNFEIDYIRKIPQNFYNTCLLMMDTIVLDQDMQYFITKNQFNWHGELKSISEIRQFNVIENMLSLYNLADYQRLFYKWVFSSFFSMWTSIANHILEDNTSDDETNLNHFLTHLKDLEEFVRLNFPILYEKYDKLAIFNIKVFIELSLSNEQTSNGKPQINLKTTSSKLVYIVKKIILDPVVEIIGMVKKTSEVDDVNTEMFGMNSIDELINVYNKFRLKIITELDEIRKQFIFLNAAYPVTIVNRMASSLMTSKTVKNYVIAGMEYWKKNSISVLIDGNKIVVKKFFIDKLKFDDAAFNKTSTIVYTAMKCHFADSINNLLGIIYQLLDMDYANALKYLLNINGSVQLVITTLFEFSDVAPNNKSGEPYFLKVVLSLYLYINYLTYNQIQSDINENNQLKRTVLQIINLNQRFAIENCYTEYGIQKLGINSRQSFAKVLNNLNNFINGFEFSEMDANYSIFNLDDVLLNNCSDLSFLLKTKVLIDDKWNNITNFSKQIEHTYDVNVIYKLLKSIYEVILKTIYKITIKTFKENKVFPLDICESVLERLQIMNCPIELVNHFRLLINLHQKGLFYNDVSILKSISDNIITPRFELLRNVELHNSKKTRFKFSKLSMVNVVNTIFSDRFKKFWWVFNFLQKDLESKSDYQYEVSLKPNITLLTIEDNNIKCNKLTKMYNNFLYLENFKNECLLKEDTRVQLTNATKCFSSIEEKHIKFSNNLLQILETWNVDKLLSGDDDLLKIIMITIIHLRNKHNTDLKSKSDNLEDLTKLLTRKKEKLKRIGDVIMNLLDNYQICNCSVIKARDVISDEFNKSHQSPDDNITLLNFTMNVDDSSNKNIAPLNNELVNMSTDTKDNKTISLKSYTEHFVIDSKRTIPKNFYDLTLLTSVKDNAALSEYLIENMGKVYFNWYGNVKNMSDILNIDIFENMLGLYQLGNYQRLFLNLITAIFYNTWKVANEFKLKCTQINSRKKLESLVESLKMLRNFIMLPFSKPYDTYMNKNEDNLALLPIKLFEELKLISSITPDENSKNKMSIITLNSNNKFSDLELDQLINKIIIKPTMEILGVVKVSGFKVPDFKITRSIKQLEDFIAYMNVFINELKYYIFF